MQVQNLQLSNIVARQQHYLQLQNAPIFNFQHQPVTHIVEKKQTINEKKYQKGRDYKQRKQLLEKSERMRKQLLIQKIASKNYRYQIRQYAEKQNKKVIEIANFLNKNKSQQLQKGLNFQNEKLDESQFKSESKNVQKIYLKNQKIQFSSTKGFTGNKQKEKNQFMRKTLTLKDQNQFKSSDTKIFKQIKLKAVKLPQLNCSKQEKVRQMSKDEIVQKPDLKVQNKKKKEKKINQQATINPILKTHDTRYFGIESRQQDFEKVSKKLLKQIRKKFWSYQCLQNQQVYIQFENFLAQDLN